MLEDKYLFLVIKNHTTPMAFMRDQYERMVETE